MVARIRREIATLLLMLVVVLMILYYTNIDKEATIHKEISKDKTEKMRVETSEMHVAEYKSVLLKDGGKERLFRYKVLGCLCRRRQNNARISPAVDNVTRKLLESYNDFGLFHLVTTFVQFDLPEIRKALFISGGGAPTDQELEARMAEVIDCLQRNLEHKNVAHVHVLVFHEESIEYLRHLDFRHSQKMIIHKSSKSPTTKSLIGYASKYLQGKSVILTHQDNYMGEGWAKVNHETLKKKQLMYALTRHPSPSECYGSKESAHCGHGYPYLGSHDTFAFHVSYEIQNYQMDEVDFTPNLYGIENVIIWTFREILKYKVLNPCKTLFMYHSHCVPIRDMNRKRINIEQRTGTANFTHLLE